jgi:hypothetical protein
VVVVAVQTEEAAAVAEATEEASHVEVPEVDVPEEATAGAISSRARSVSCVARRATMS